MMKFIATSVVRGSQQGESHGGVYLIDCETEKYEQVIDWNTMDIDWQGRGWDRGLRGIAFDNNRVFIAASDELFEYDTQFKHVASYKNPFLKHCHEISIYRRRLFISSTGFDSIVGFDLDKNRFSYGLNIIKDFNGYRALPFHPEQEKGPQPSNQLHLNSIFCNNQSLFFSGLNTGGLFGYTGKHIQLFAKLPMGTHNAQPFGNGVIFNDTQSNVVKYIGRDGASKEFPVPFFDAELLTHTELDNSQVARQGFGRGLCVVSEHLIAGGSSPSTISLYSFGDSLNAGSHNLSMDIRNSIHGLEVWPF